MAPADEPPTSVASKPPGGEAIQSDPPRPTGWESPADGNDAQPARFKTTISLTANSVIVSYGEGESSLQVAPGAKAVIVCDSFNAEAAPGERPKLHCRQCEVTLPNGSIGQAADVEYDTATKMLTLTGTDGQPVKLASNRDGGGQRIKAPKMEIELDFSAQPAFPIPTPATYYAPQPLTAEPSILKPNPIHRLEKALIAD
jgi:hypothetical protein